MCWSFGTVNCSCSARGRVLVSECTRTCTAYGADNRTLLNIPVLYSGLAPGLAGVYQLDMRVPASNLRSDFSFACVGKGDSRGFYGSFWVKP